MLIADKIKEVVRNTPEGVILTGSWEFSWPWLT